MTALPASTGQSGRCGTGVVPVEDKPPDDADAALASQQGPGAAVDRAGPAAFVLLNPDHP